MNFHKDTNGAISRKCKNARTLHERRPAPKTWCDRKHASAHQVLQFHACKSRHFSRLNGSAPAGTLIFCPSPQTRMAVVNFIMVSTRLWPYLVDDGVPELQVFAVIGRITTPALAFRTVFVHSSRYRWDTPRSGASGTYLSSNCRNLGDGGRGFFGCSAPGGFGAE